MKNNIEGTKRKTCSSKMNRKWPSLVLVVSLLVFCLLVIFKWLALDLLVEKKISEEVRLEPGSSTWNKWLNITVPIYLKFYFFNVSNPIDVMRGSKPILKEVGPYVYQEKRLKFVQSFDHEKDTISYRQRISYYFRRDLSSGNEKDRIILINVPFVSLAKLTKDMTNISIAQGIVDRSLRQRGERLFTYNTVREYLFDGWSIQSYITFLRNPLLQIVGASRIPKAFQGGKFGFYKGKNNTDDGELVIRTGITNPKDFGRIVSWNGQTKLKHWSGKCNQINGTDGSILPPFITKKEILRFFIPDLCRSLLMVYGNETKVKGVKAYRFVLPDPKPIFESEDFCFCPNPRKYECYKTGVFSLSPCRENAPIAVSAPHFFQAWEPYERGVKGLKPNPAQHDTFLDVEPKTGLILNGVKRIQFNVKLERNPHMSTFARVPNVLFPFMWAEESAEINDELLNEIRVQLYGKLEMAEMLSLGGLFGTSLLILLGIIGCFIVTCRETENVKDEITSNEEQIYSNTEIYSTIIKKEKMTDEKLNDTKFEPYAYINRNPNETNEKISKI